MTHRISFWIIIILKHEYQREKYTESLTILVYDKYLQVVRIHFRRLDSKTKKKYTGSHIFVMFASF